MGEKGLANILRNRSGQVRSGQVRSGQVRSGQVRSGQVRSGQGRSGQVRSGQVRSKAETKNDLKFFPPKFKFEMDRFCTK
jgi:hypothetical protein